MTKITPEEVIETIRKLHKKIKRNSILFSEIKKELKITDKEIIKVVSTWDKDMIIYKEPDEKEEGFVWLNPPKKLFQSK